jgi:hypothetical protein
MGADATQSTVRARKYVSDSIGTRGRLLRAGTGCGRLTVYEPRRAIS